MNGFVVTDTDQNLFKRLEEKLYRETNEAKDILANILRRYFQEPDHEVSLEFSQLTISEIKGEGSEAILKNDFLRFSKFDVVLAQVFETDRELEKKINHVRITLKDMKSSIEEVLRKNKKDSPSPSSYSDLPNTLEYMTQNYLRLAREAKVIAHCPNPDTKEYQQLVNTLISFVILSEFLAMCTLFMADLGKLCSERE